MILSCLIYVLCNSTLQNGAVAADDHSNATWDAEESKSGLVTRNLLLKYVVMGVELLIGVVLLPFNVAHLGQAAYGIWALSASITAYFSMLDLGYGLAQERFVAHYRARRDAESLNKVISTLFFVFAAIGLLAFSIAVAVGMNLEHLFKVTPDQARVGQRVLTVMGAYVALSFPFGVFGGVVNGFLRNYRNGITAICTSVIAAIVNIVVLATGHGLFELVAAVYSVRALSYLFYRRNAYKVFPGLQIRLSHFDRSSLREVTSFSVFILVIDLANKINYSTDAVVVGAFLGAASVAIWTVAQRLIETTQRLTNQLNGSLFAVVVDSATIGSCRRLQMIMLQGTRLSLAMVVPMATCLAVLARPLVLAWTGPEFASSVPVIYFLSIVVAVRVGNATATTLLKGAGDHKLLAKANIVMSLANLGLSATLAGRYGLVGVALGTLIPVVVISAFWIFPLGCRRAGLEIRRVLAGAVWPAVWPMSIVTVLLLASRTIVGSSLLLVGLDAVAAGALYCALFLRFAVEPSDRRWYLANLMLISRRPRISALA